MSIAVLESVETSSGVGPASGGAGIASGGAGIPACITPVQAQPLCPDSKAKDSSKIGTARSHAGATDVMHTLKKGGQKCPPHQECPPCQALGSESKRCGKHTPPHPANDMTSKSRYRPGHDGF